VTSKVELHRLVDDLPARLLHDLRDEMDEEPLSKQDLASVERGLEDLSAGRSVTLAELKQKYGL
jgi:hypothetical protein